MDLAVKPQDKSCVRAAECGSVLDEGLQHRLKIKRRAAYDFQNFARSRLLIEGFGEITIPGP
jgi:hypothetical protein